MEDWQEVVLLVLVVLVAWVVLPIVLGFLAHAGWHWLLVGWNLLS